MVKISAFKALRPHNNLVEHVPTQAYSNYKKLEIEATKKNNQYSFLNIIHQDHIDDQKKRFESIKVQLGSFIDKEILVKEDKPAIYVYTQIIKNMEFTGLICAIDLNDYKNQKIKVHEKTIEKRELLFAKYLSITKIYAEPVLITHESKYTYTKHINKSNLLYDFTTPDKVQHKIWKISEKIEIKKITNHFKNIEYLYIADGHHRMASSSRLTDNNLCLAYILPKKELQIYPFHRAVITKYPNEDIINKIRQTTQVQYIKKPTKNSKNIEFYFQKKWYSVNTEIQKDTLDNLLVNKLLNQILKPIFNIKDERNNKNIRFISGTTGTNEIINDLKKNEILFMMNSININTIIDIAHQDKTTPPKSTFILPKLPSGLIMMKL